MLHYNTTGEAYGDTTTLLRRRNYGKTGRLWPTHNQNDFSLLVVNMFNWCSRQLRLPWKTLPWGGWENHRAAFMDSQEIDIHPASQVKSGVNADDDKGPGDGVKSKPPPHSVTSEDIRLDSTSNSSLHSLPLTKWHQDSELQKPTDLKSVSLGVLSDVFPTTSYHSFSLLILRILESWS